MTIIPAATVTAAIGPAEWFTGTVRLEELAGPATGSPMRAYLVFFDAGARTAWHTHPHGQALRIVSGVGRVQKAGGAPVEVRPGDVVWFEPGERHWHGAAPGEPMVHFATQVADENGKAATWFEHVSDADYTRPTAESRQAASGST